jgi:hypothetical protein
MEKDTFDRLRDQANADGRKIALRLNGDEELTVQPSDIVGVYSTRIELEDRIIFFSSDLIDASLV